MAVYWLALKLSITQWVHNARLTTILPYKLDTTNDLLTFRAGLLAIAIDYRSINGLSEPAERIDKHFPLPASNRELRPSEFIKTLILIQHEGSFHLQDIRHIQDDEALRSVVDLNRLPQAITLGDWLRRMGSRNYSPHSDAAFPAIAIWVAISGLCPLLAMAWR